MSGWDYIIVGAGSAGCVLANRLSANPANRVLLLEAGGSDRALKYNVVAMGALSAIGNPDSDWMMASEPDPSRAGRVDLMTRGKVLGGSSAINGTIYMRGNRGDYDHWAQLGNRGWDYDSLVKIFRRMEDAQGELADMPTYGHGGPMKISRTKGASPLAYRFIEAMAELGVPSNPDFNGEQQTGAFITNVTQRRGWRWSAARGYLHPAMSRPNLKVITGVLARRVLFDGKRAVGVEFEQGGEIRNERCSGEVIISASAFNSPKLLMLSGVGDPATLGEHGISVVHGNTHVGRNLQEHPHSFVQTFIKGHSENLDANSRLGRLRHAARFALFGSGAATYVFPALAFVKLKPESEYPDIQFHFGAFISEITESGLRMLDRPGITLMAGVNRSQSRGFVTLKSSDPQVQPLIQPNMLGSQYDVDMIVQGIKLCRRLLKTKAFAPIVEDEATPGKAVVDDGALEAYVRASASPSYHCCGSVKMGVDDAAVVDPELRVIGVEGLRVADSSIIPQVPSGNINAVSILIGEKASDAILAARKG